jgi:thioester reductase-like protein
MQLRVLVTGARGLLGAEVIARLQSLNHSVVGVVSSGTAISRNDGTSIAADRYQCGYPRPGHVCTVFGDITKERLGFTNQLYDELATSTDLIVHCAAITKFGQAAEHYEAVNLHGTRRVIEFAATGTPSPTALVHVSTAYVCGAHVGPFGEADLDLGQRFGNLYEQSKYHGEACVRDAMLLGVPATVLRPSIVVGDSKTGVIRRFDTLYTIVRLTSAGTVRMLPADYGATLDIVPVDWVADCVAQTIENLEAARGMTLHLTSGEPVSLRDITEVCAEFPSLRVPRCVPRHLFETVEMNPIEKRHYRKVISLYESYLTRHVRFTKNSTRQILQRDPSVRGKRLLRRIFRYAIQTGYFIASPARNGRRS